MVGVLKSALEPHTNKLPWSASGSHHAARLTADVSRPALTLCYHYHYLNSKVHRTVQNSWENGHIAGKGRVPHVAPRPPSADTSESRTTYRGAIRMRSDTTRHSPFSWANTRCSERTQRQAWLMVSRALLFYLGSHHFCN